MSTFGGMQGGGGGGGWLSSLTSMVGGIFLTSDDTQPVVRGQRNRYTVFLHLNLYLAQKGKRILQLNLHNASGFSLSGFFIKYVRYPLGKLITDNC